MVKLGVSFCFVLFQSLGAEEMALWVKVFAVKADDLSLVPADHVVERAWLSHRSSSNLHLCGM